MPSLTEALLGELRVVDAQIAVLQIGQGAAASFGKTAKSSLHIVTEGKFDLILPNLPTLHLQRGDVSLVFFDDPHVITPSLEYYTEQHVVFPSYISEEPETINVGSPPWQGRVISFSLELSYLDPAAAVIRAAPTLWTLRRDGADSPSNLFDIDRLSDAAQGVGSSAVLTLVSNALFAYMIRDYYKTLWPHELKDVRAPGVRRVAAALQAIHAHPDRPWNLENLGKLVGLSRSRFAATFSKEMGLPPAAYISKIRLEKAAELLRGGGMSITEIALRTGFPVTSSFSRSFSRHYQISPKNFAVKYFRGDERKIMQDKERVLSGASHIYR